MATTLEDFKKKINDEYNQSYDNLTSDQLGKFTMRSGKHKGRTFKDIFDNVNDYAVWCYTNKSKITGPLELFVKYIEKLLNPTIVVEDVDQSPGTKTEFFLNQVLKKV